MKPIPARLIVPVLTTLLVLAGCGFERSGAESAGASDEPLVELEGTRWLLEDLANAGVLDRAQATLEFGVAGAVSGSGSCNRFVGSVAIDGDAITFGDLATTRMLCAEAVMDQETRYLAALSGAERFQIDGPFLYVFVADEAAPLRFIGVSERSHDPSSEAAADLRGSWTIVGHQIPGISAMSDAEAKTWYGRTVSFAATEVVSIDDRCDEPVYTSRSMSKREFQSRESRLVPGQLHPLDSMDHLTVVEVSCSAEPWAALGAFMIRIDAGSVFAPWDGVFFELARRS